jgi:hypothetical protein
MVVHSVKIQIVLGACGHFDKFAQQTIAAILDLPDHLHDMWNCRATRTRILLESLGFGYNPIIVPAKMSILMRRAISRPFDGRSSFRQFSRA